MSNYRGRSAKAPHSHRHRLPNFDACIFTFDATLTHPTSMETTTSLPRTQWLLRSPLSRLPQEICDRIIDMSGLASRPLLAFCLVCRAWLPRARLHLFRWACLENESQAQGFLRMVSTYPRYGEFTKNLSISGSPKEGTDDGPSCQWIHRIVLLLPPLLPNLQELDLISLPVLHPTFPILCSRFKTVHSLSLTSNNEMSFCEVIKLVNGFPSLRSLDLDIDDELRGVARFHKRRRQPLATLRVNLPSAFKTQGEFAKWIVARQSASQLAEVTWSVWSNLDANLDAILERCSQTLKELTLTLWEYKGGRPWSMLPSSFTPQYFSAHNFPVPRSASLTRDSCRPRSRHLSPWSMVDDSTLLLPSASVTHFYHDNPSRSISFGTRGIRGLLQRGEQRQLEENRPHPE